ncbi:hypothetical protein [Streptomyces clavifer]|uniref:hypothetical protein n=1 Tax=Streptomyces clavifer TaxID=68188 RepID=UPI00380C9779
MSSTDLNMIEHPYGGCGKCLLCVCSLSRKLATSSPERSGDILVAVGAVGGHIIGWADGWEVSGARPDDPPARAVAWRRERPLRRCRRRCGGPPRTQLLDSLNTGYWVRDEGKLLVTLGPEARLGGLGL